MAVLETMGFKGSLAWVHNEEGSGAKYYNSSCYFPDSRLKPQSCSGITIDPGLDLGQADDKLISEVLEFYLGKGLMDLTQVTLLKKAEGLTKYDAIEWIRKNEKYFKGKMLIPFDDSLFVMDKYTAPLYWKPLIEKMPELLLISPNYKASAVHTAVLSYSYNRGSKRTIEIAQDYLKLKNYDGLARAISNTYHSMKSLRDRRKKEAKIILDALEKKSQVSVDLSINPLPLTTINTEEVEKVLSGLQLQFIEKEQNNV